MLLYSEDCTEPKEYTRRDMLEAFEAAGLTGAPGDCFEDEYISDKRKEFQREWDAYIKAADE